MLLSIIIVNYNSKYFAEQCLCSVAAATKDITTEVFVVDNASTDQSISYLESKFDWVNFIASDRNLGFAKANNLALSKASGAYVLFLNPDTIIPEDCITTCISHLQARPDAGAIGMRMIDGAGNFLPESKRALPSPLVSFWKLIGMSAILPKSSFFNQYALGHLDENENHEIPVLSGAFMCCNTALIKRLDGFDERFFMYGEDIDLSYRISKAGYQNLYLGQLAIIHFKGESTPLKNFNYVRIFYKAMQQFVDKHYSSTYAGIVKIFLYLSILIRAMLTILMLPFSFMSTKSNIKYSLSKKGSFFLSGDGLSTQHAYQILQENGIPAMQKIVTLSNTLSDSCQLVFCTGRMSYKECLQFCCTHKSTYTYYWHGLSTHCIISSPSKNAAGIVYTFQKNK